MAVMPRIAIGRLLGLLLPLWFATACQTPNDSADFASNDELYADVPYVTRSPGDRAVFVAPVVDQRSQRKQPLPTQHRGFPINYSDERVWERPVTVMVAEVLERQLRDSSLFAALEPTPSPQSLVVVPSLQSFHCGVAEAMAGSSAFAELAMRLQIYGPVGPDGRRALLLDESFADLRRSETMFEPITPYRLVGPALQNVMKQVLPTLDGSNVGRSSVPMAVALPASFFTADLGF